LTFAGAIEIEDLKKIAADMMENWTADQLQVHFIALIKRARLAYHFFPFFSLFLPSLCIK
jgi:hypothetical protein